MEFSMRKFSNEDKIFPNPDKVLSFHVPCYVCGELTKFLYILYAKKNIKKISYFPFLEMYKPPKSALSVDNDGSIAACLCCYAFLNCQWDLYEKNKVPYTKRIYWLKRTDGKPFSGIMSGAQSEYASQILGLSSEQSLETLDTTNVFNDDENINRDVHSVIKRELHTNSEVEQSEALDLSIDNKSINSNLVPEICHLHNIVKISQNENSKSMCCMICRLNIEKCVNDNQSSIPLIDLTNILNEFQHSFISQDYDFQNKETLLNHFKLCENCSTKLRLMHEFYVFKGIKNENRNYYLNGHFSNKTLVTCVACNIDISNQSVFNKSVTNDRSSSHNSGFLSLAPQIPSSDNCSLFKKLTDNKQVDLCCSCLWIICCEPKGINLCSQDCDLTNKAFDQCLKNRMLYEKSIDDYKSGDKELKFALPCDFCSSYYKFIDMEKIFLSIDPNNSKKYFFPALKYLSLIDGSKVCVQYMLSCVRCHDILCNSTFLKLLTKSVCTDLVSTLTCLTNMLCEMRSELKWNNKAIISSNETSLCQQENESKLMSKRCELLRIDDKSKIIENIEIGTTIVPFYFDKGVWEPLLEEFEMKSDDIDIKIPLTKLQNSLNIGVNCFICGHFSNPGSTYVIWYKYFNQLKVTNCHNNWKNNDIGLVCTICFHSLLCQRQEFGNANIAYSERKYMMSWYFCYVCSAGTFRARLHLLPVKAFPFLLKHIATKKGIVVNRGADVIVCRDCYETLNSQYLEMERLRVPVEMRQYNWIKRPPPDPEEASTSSSFLDMPIDVKKRRHK